MVSLLKDPTQEPLNVLKVISNYQETKEWDPKELEPDVKKMAVCVKPLHYDYNKVKTCAACSTHFNVKCSRK